MSAGARKLGIMAIVYNNENETTLEKKSKDYIMVVDANLYKEVEEDRAIYLLTSNS